LARRAAIVCPPPDNISEQVMDNLRMTNATPDFPAQSRPRFGFKVGLHTTPAGVIALAPLPDHLLGMHVGAPIRAACRCGGRMQRRLQIHGDIDVVPAGQEGYWEDELSATVLSLRLSPALMRTAAEGLGVESQRVGIAPRFQLRDQQIEHIGWALKAELEAGYPGGQLYAESLGLALATRLLYLNLPHSKSAIQQYGLSERQLHRVSDYIEANLDRDLSLDQLAEIVGLRASHFKALFKHSTGLPVHQFVIRRRVERARALLLKGELPTGQIALEAGFAHQSHMARWMRRLLGVTPTDIARSRF
jgi:AraC family transcriptional regulator